MEIMQNHMKKSKIIEIYTGNKKNHKTTHITSFANYEIHKNQRNLKEIKENN